MNEYEVLRRAVCKATKNGYRGLFSAPVEYDEIIIDTEGIPIETILFDHNFAKAFWGEKLVCACHGIREYTKCGAIYDIENEWMYHLKQLVISEDKLEYIKDFI